MPKVSKESAPGGGDFGPVTDRSGELDGYTVNFGSFANVVDATIRRLRKAVDEGFDTPLIHTVRGVGYKIKAP